MVEQKHFRVATEEGIVVVQLVDPMLFDTLIISELQDELLEFLEREEPRRVMVSFDGVAHCSTSVINALLRAKKRLLINNGRLTLCCMEKPIREAYQMLNLDGTVFSIYDSREEAVAALQD